MADNPKRLYGPAQLTNAAATKYTVPAATQAILREIHVCNTTSSSATLTLSIGADAAGTRLWDALVIPAHGAFDWTGNIPMEATEILQAYSDTSSALTLTVAGLEVTA